jgi:hypothetical protein
MKRKTAVRTTVITICALAGASWPSRFGSTQPFDPVSKLTTWYTDRNPIDIEIVATVGAGEEARPADPPRVLRLRLERAYVHTVFRRPNSSSVAISFDLPTGLPSALFRAPTEQVEMRGDPIRQLPHQEMITRTINLLVQSNASSDLVKRMSIELGKCRGAQIQNDLFAYDKDRDRTCLTRSLGFRTKYIGRISEDDWLFIQCTNAPIGCTASFPFEGVLPSVSFSESHLSHWKWIIEQAADFLRSKKVS